MRRPQYVLKGALAGAAATVPMSAVMWLAQRAGYLGQQPPERITEVALSAVHARPERPEHENALASANHLLFGAVCGTVYSLLREGGPRPAPDLIAGLAFGLSVWVVSYEGWVPALGILPKVQWDKPGRPESMALAHAVFGVSLAGLLRRLRA